MNRSRRPQSFALSLLSALLVLATLPSLSGCGKNTQDNTQPAKQERENVINRAYIAWIKGDWVGDASDSSSRGGSMSISADGRQFSISRVRQVGSRDDAEVPYPTICNSRESSSQFALYETGGGNYRYSFNYLVQKVELVEDARNDAACSIFIKRMQDLADKGFDLYDISLNQTADNKITTSEGTFIHR
jgi:hypothetical protein